MTKYIDSDIQQRTVSIGTTLVRYHQNGEEHYAPTTESASWLRVSFTDLVILSLLAVFWGLIFLFILEAWVL